MLFDQTNLNLVLGVTITLSHPIIFLLLRRTFQHFGAKAKQGREDRFGSKISGHGLGLKTRWGKYDTKRQRRRRPNDELLLAEFSMEGVTEFVERYTSR